MFIEPRLRLLGGRGPARSNYEVGVLTRAGLGMLGRATVTPTILAPGLYVARLLRRGDSGNTWSLSASYSRSWISQPQGASAEQADRLSLGLGWYL